MNPFRPPRGAPDSHESRVHGGIPRWAIAFLHALVVLVLLWTFSSPIPMDFLLLATLYGALVGIARSFSRRGSQWHSILIGVIATAGLCGFFAGLAFGVKETVPDFSRSMSEPGISKLTSYFVRQSLARAVSGTLLGLVVGAVIGGCGAVYRFRVQKTG